MSEEGESTTARPFPPPLSPPRRPLSSTTTTFPASTTSHTTTSAPSPSPQRSPKTLSWNSYVASRSPACHHPTSIQRQHHTALAGSLCSFR